jgi:C1A family cysteine protease
MAAKATASRKTTATRKVSATRKVTTSKAQKHGYGWMPDLPDHRDFMFAAIRPIPAALPTSIDLRPMCSPIEDQGQLGSCTGNAIAGALEFLEMKDQVPFIDLSRLFIYYNERVMEHTVKSDAGAQIRDGIKSVAKQGVCSEKKWPYRISKFATKPTAACYKEALKHRITVYQRLVTVDEMRACLADGYPFVFGFTVYESFESQAVAQTGVAQMPLPDERVLGGHAVLGVGYDDAGQRFIVRNSWGTGWGQQGYFTMPYAYLANRHLASDFWTVRR